LGRAAASLSGWKGEGRTLSDAELQRRPLPARGHISRRVFLDRSWRADHVPGIRKLLVSSLAVASLVAGCGSTSRATLKPTRVPGDTASPTATPAEIATPTPSAEPTDAAILNAYEQASAAWDAAASIPEVDYPGITQWMTGYSLATAQADLSELVGDGWVLVGSYEPHAVVASVNGTTATVQDCGWDTRYYVYKATGKPVTPQPWGGTTQPGWDSITGLMVLQSGTWRVTNLGTELNTSCAPTSSSP